MKSESSPSKRLHQLLNPRLFHSISSAKELGVRVNRGTSVTHTHAQFFYKTAKKKGASPTTNLLASKEKTSFNSKTKTLNASNGKTAGATRESFKPSSGSFSAKP
jgi:hypothetical protein